MSSPRQESRFLKGYMQTTTCLESPLILESRGSFPIRSRDPSCQETIKKLRHTADRHNVGFGGESSLLEGNTPPINKLGLINVGSTYMVNRKQAIFNGTESRFQAILVKLVILTLIVLVA